MTTEAVYSSAQVARMLGVSGGMVRRYALTLEELTGEPIPQHARDGRQFSQEHVDALVAARRFVAGRQGMSVETGLRLALGLAELPAATLSPTVTDASGAVGAEALKAALGEHIGPLLTQLQTVVESNMQLMESNVRLSEEVAALRQGNAELLELRARVAALEAGRALPPADPATIDRALELEQQAYPAAPEDLEDDQTSAGDGVLVRAARWLEARLGRGRRG
jgi:hypothetical protein